MKRILTFLLCLLAVVTASAQTFDALWKKAEAAIASDHPQSALKQVGQIHQKAIGERNEAQLLRAILVRLQLKGEISPDSAAVHTALMEQALRAETDPVVKALWHSALAQVYTQRASRSWPRDTAAVSASLRHAEAALLPLQVLADAKAKDYLPLFALGKQSGIYADDLLHVLLLTHIDQENAPADWSMQQLRRVIPIYASRHLFDAVFTLRLDSISRHFRHHQLAGPLADDAQFRALRTLADEYAASPWSVLAYDAMVDLTRDETDSLTALCNDSSLLAIAHEGIGRYSRHGHANHLRNYVDRMQRPSATMQDFPAMAYPASKVKLTLRSRNLRGVALRITRIYDSQLEARTENANHAKRAAQLRRQSCMHTYRLAERPAYQWQETKVDFEMPQQPGVYFLELLADGRKVLDTQTFNVSALQAMVFTYPTHCKRVTAIDSRTGHPVKGARIVQTCYGAKLGRERQVKVWQADSLGTVMLTDEARGCDFYVMTSTDQAALPFTLRNQGYYAKNADRVTTTVDLFTDRAIYRPGQQVQVNAVAFTQQGDHVEVARQLRGTLVLRNVNRRVVDSLLVVTDEWGSCSAKFTLPSTTLTGRFLLEFTSGAIRATRALTVEEYRRPTFTTEVEPLRQIYALGDTARVAAVAHTYTDVPVAQARVQWSVSRQAWGWRWGYRPSSQMQRGETLTDADGRFQIPVVLVADTDEPQHANGPMCHYFTVDYTVTAPNGETVTGSTVVRTANRRAWLEISSPAQFCRTAASPVPLIRVREVNAAGTTMEAEGQFEALDADGHRVGEGNYVSGNPVKVEGMQQWADGIYTFVFRSAHSDVQPDTTRIQLFSDTLKRPIDRQTVLFAHDLRSAQGDSVHVMIGSPQNHVLLFRDVLSGGRLLESTRMEISDTVLHDRLTYRDEYGDGADVYYAFVRDGEIFTHHASVMKPVPDKRLKMEWTSFRSRLTPGAKEEWRLRVTRPDGAPVAAQVMACLYDASLDALATNSWRFTGPSFGRYHTYAHWTNHATNHTLVLDGSLDGHRLSFESPFGDFTHWRSELFSRYGGRYVYAEELSCLTRRGSRNTAMGKMKSAPMLRESAVEMSDRVASAEEMEDAAERTEYGLENGDAGNGNAADAVVPRTNFAETAFFRPSVLTDEGGVATMGFTLPESTTQWRFMALAHTAAMDHGRLDTMAVARKEFMVQTALPRFVREGDRTQLPVQLTNLSSHTVKAVLTLRLTDALSGQVVMTKRQQVELARGEVRTYGFDFAPSAGQALLVCRATARGNGFSDGEEHYLPVLSSEVEITRTLPFSLHGKETGEWRIDTLMTSHATHRSLTVELTSNPTWTVVNALPALTTDARTLSATDWASRYFALAVGRHIGALHPEIDFLLSRPDEADALASLHLDGLSDLTPWLRQAIQEKQRAAELHALFNAEAAAVRIFTAVDKLKALQTVEGGWSWCPGMPANDFITTETAIILSRAKRLTGQTEADELTARALAYLRKRMADEVKAMKKVERETKRQLRPTEVQLRYLYLLTAMDRKADDNDARFLLERAKKLRHELSMYGQAMLAVVMEANGEHDEAKRAVEALVQHTVTHPEMGRYFDTERARLSASSFRIPTQCATIEALERMGRSPEAADMRQWLLQSKRTQMWQTVQATAEAVFSLLSTPSAAVAPLQSTEPLAMTLLRGKKIVALNAPSQTSTPTTAGYFRQTFTASPAVDATTLKVRSVHDGTAWGAVYASGSVPASEVKTAGHGLHLERRMEVLRQGKWVAVSEVDALSKGDRLRQVYTLRADRDFDFVVLQSQRAACFQPVDALSGYEWSDGLSIYRSVRDASTDFFINQLPKGTRVFTEEFHLDRSGRYVSGIATLSSAYSPEFSATCAETALQVE